MTTRVVETTGIRKVYGAGAAAVEALRGIEMNVEAGELVAITGRSAAGKSTLMHILGCLDRPTGGIYLLAGQDVSSLPDVDLSSIRATQIGFVFQNFNLVPQCTVLENVTMPFLYRTQGCSEADIILRAETAIHRVGLTERKGHRPAELSGGEMQRAAIARAIVMRPLLILADEPTGNLDAGTSEEILELFHELNSEGTTLIIVTHSDRVASRCRRVVRLREGRVDTLGAAA